MVLQHQVGTEKHEGINKNKKKRKKNITDLSNTNKKKSQLFLIKFIKIATIYFKILNLN